MATENFPTPEVEPTDTGVDVIAFSLPIKRMTLEQAQNSSFLYDSDFFWEFFPGKWPQGAQLLKPITQADLDKAYEIGKLGEAEPLLVANKARIATYDQRAYAWLAGRGKCAYCETNAHPDYMQIDHYVPFSKGGETVVSNLVCSCKKCNVAKYTEDPLVFAELIKQPRGGLYRNWLYSYYRQSMGRSAPPVTNEQIDEVLMCLEEIRKQQKENA